MKLLFVLKRIGLGGGIPTIILNRLNYLSEHTDYEIHVVTELKSNEVSLSKYNSKVKFHVLDLTTILNKKRLPLFGYFSLIKDVKVKYQEFIDSLQPDIITTFNHGYNTDIIPFIKTPAIKIVELHGSYASIDKLKKADIKKSVIDIFRKNFKTKQNQYDYAVCISKEDALDRTYLEIDKKVIYNSFTIPEKVSDFKKRNNRIVSAGTLTHNKNFGDLIKAAHLIKDKLKGWEIEIYGEGEQSEFLYDLINEYSLNEIVSLKGFSHNLSDVYDNSKLLISTSLSEGFGMTILEALSYKVPVISYDCKCGPKEIVKDKVNGFLIDFDYRILARKIEELVVNENLLNEFSNNTLLSLEKFYPEKIMNEWVSFYNNLSEIK